MAPVLADLVPPLHVYWAARLGLLENRQQHMKSGDDARNADTWRKMQQYPLNLLHSHAHLERHHVMDTKLIILSHRDERGQDGYFLPLLRDRSTLEDIPVSMTPNIVGQLWEMLLDRGRG